MDSPTTPEKRRANRTVITSPYFRERTSKRSVKVELDYPVSPSISRRPDYNLPMGPEIDTDAPCSVTLDGDDIRWYEGEDYELENPLHAFKLRRSISLRYRLHCVKPKLIQEELASDPWKLLVVVILLNKTAGKAAIPVFRRIMDLWPTPEALSSANEDELRSLIQPLGLQSTRTKRLIKLSSHYLSEPPHPDKQYPSRAQLVYVQVHPGTQRAKAIVRTTYPPTSISHLPGVGAYALDSYRIFCVAGDEWKAVLPTDKELIRYLKWRWAYTENRRWEPDRGVVGPLDEGYFEALLSLINA